MQTGFFAYPSNPPSIGTVIESALESLSKTGAEVSISSWTENDVVGRFIVDPVLDQIEETDFLAADITKLNFNVTYEIGYAIGQRKRVILLKNGSIRDDADLIKEVGIYDTLAYKTYINSNQLVSFLRSAKDVRPLSVDSGRIDTKSPVYIVLPRNRTDFEVHLISRLKKAGLHFRSFDPEESGRLSALDAISNVGSSLGVIIPLLSSDRNEAVVHNLRAAFVAGLSAGLEKETLLLQLGSDPVPLDYRDFVNPVQSVAQVEGPLGDFAPRITGLLQSGRKPVVVEPKSFLAKLNLLTAAQRGSSCLQ